MSVINVCLSCDDNYAKYAGVLITSILYNAKDDDNLSIYVLDGGISNLHKDEILSLKSIKDCEINIVPIKEELYTEYKQVKTLKHISFATFYRLKLSSLLPDIDRIIYFDCDMVVCSDLKDLYNTDLGDNYFGGCLDIGWKKLFKVKRGYINAGMILFDLNKMRENDVERKFYEYTKNHLNNLKFGDQDILNYSCKGHIAILDERWNVQSSNFTNRSSYTNEPKVIHFIAKRKPWHWASFSYHRDLYFKYLQMSPYKLSDDDLKHWTKDNQKASLIAYIKHRPLFFMRFRFYKAIFLTYILPIFSCKTFRS